MERNNHQESGARGFLKRKNLRGGLEGGRFCQRGYYRLRKQHRKGNFQMIPAGRSCLKTIYMFQTISDVCLCMSLIKKVEFAFLSV